MLYSPAIIGVFIVPDLFNSYSGNYQQQKYSKGSTHCLQLRLWQSMFQLLTSGESASFSSVQMMNINWYKLHHHLNIALRRKTTSRYNATFEADAII